MESNMIKALFFDLDGTLLTSGKAIAPSAREAILACREKDVRVYIATGRSPRLDMTLGWSADTLSLFDGGVYSNGACVMLDDTARWAHIAPQAVAECVRLADQHGVHVSLHIDNDDHAFNFTLPRSVWGPWGVNEGNILPLNPCAMARTVKLLIFHENLVDSVTVLPPALFADLQSAAGDAVSLYLTDHGCTIQAAAKQVSKLTGIEQIRTSLGLAEDEIAVFGDDLNDLEMISAYPVSVAMGNAVEAVKAAAKHVTIPNDEGGIAHALKEILHVI
jgi:hydroxymethylpyrimidine pyrophosphatase-like HAD family hydrolase